MGTWNAASPAELELAAWEQQDRAEAVAASGSAAPATYRPLPDPPAVYTHVGHAAQYGRGRRNGRTIRFLALHVTDVNGTALGAASYDARRPDQVSATAFAGPNGELVLDVAEADRAFTTGRWNDESASLEIVGHDEWTAAQWRARPRQLEAIVRWLVDLCQRHNIPAVWLDADDVAAGASRQGAAPVQGVNRGITDHLNANLAARALGASTSSTSHVCVGAGLRSIVIAELIPEAARRLAGTTPPTRPPATTWRPPMTALHMADPEPRLVDTRIALGLARPVLDSSFTIVLPDDHDPTAAILHVTTVGASGAGYLTLYGDNAGNTSKLNYAPGDPSPQANTTLVNVGRDTAGRPVVRGMMRGAGTAELIVDLVAVIA